MTKTNRLYSIGAILLAVALVVGLASCSSSKKVSPPVRGAAAEINTVYACLNLRTGRFEVGSAGGNIIRAYAPVCPSGEDVVWTWTGKTYVPTTTTTPSPTTIPTPTTTPITPPTTTPGPIGNSPPPKGGYFQQQPPGTPIKSDAVCAAAIHRSTWEPRPENAQANSSMPITTGSRLGNFGSYTSTWNQNYRPRITGALSQYIAHPTTDEVIQWVACKWGWSDEEIRGEAVQESSWRNSSTGDSEARSRGHCPFDVTSDPCFTSYGLMQSKWYYEPENQPSGTAGSGYPSTKISTAFIVDLFAAQMRGCYDGQSSYLNGGAGKTTGDLWGCIQSWYSGSWTAGGGSYATSVKNHIAQQEWLGYRGSAHNVP